MTSPNNARPLLAADSAPPADSRNRPDSRRRADPTDLTRSIVSPIDLQSRSRRWTLRLITGALLAVLLVVCAGPALMLAKLAVSTSADIVGNPLAWWPNGFQPENLTNAWQQIKIGQYTLNTIMLASGAVISTLVVCLTGGYSVAVLQRRYARFVDALVLATLFVPNIVALIPLYLTVIELRMIDTMWAIWLPVAANAFTFLIARQFAQGIPKELFESAKIDGAGPFRMFWYIFLPLTKPIAGVITLLTFTAAWKEFLWPLLALPSDDLQPLSVALTRVNQTADISLVMAGMFITVLIPVILFLMFQKQFLRSAGTAGALKG